MSKTREVMAGHGHDRAMGYRYRARVERRRYRTFGWFGLKKIELVTEWRWVIEYKHMAWRDCDESDMTGRWVRDKERAVKGANIRLDEIEDVPKGEYV